MTEPALVPVLLEGVGKRFGGGPWVLRGVQFAARRGDFVGLIGPSGCGKSTLLRLISGLSAPAEGRIEVCGGPPLAARDRLAYIFQDATLLPWLTVAGNIAAPLRLRGVPRVRRQALAAEMLERVRLRTVADRYPRQLSGGMRMRVSVARALALRPEILLLDEPFGALDEMTRNHLNEELLGLRAHQEWTAFFVTHSVAEAVFLSNRILVLAPAPGRILAEIAVPFPYPRGPELRERGDYQSLVAEVSRVLRSVEVAA